ncbi:hypothetical protein [Streptomyces sp. NPDC057325]|uniref:hypothetical protein n=1 Tax=unclassified Streptomyces TaxID=2593676 RepID=UPI00362AFE22
MEINAVAELLHQYMDQAGLSLKEVHDAIVSDMLPLDIIKPSQRKMYDLLDGKGLEKPIAEAIIDVCSGPAGDAGLDKARREEVGALFLRAEQNPTLVRPDVPVFVDLVAAQNMTIQKQTELDEARQALQKSTEARSQAENVAAGLRMMLARQNKMLRELTQECDRLIADSKRRPALQATLDQMQQRMQQMQEKEKQTQATLLQAERDRDDARKTAAEAQRVISELTEEIHRLRTTSPGTDADTDSAAAAIMLPATSFDFSGYDADMEESDAALSAAQTLLEHGREAVEEAGRSIGYERDLDPGVIAGQVVQTPQTPGEKLSGTTPDNAGTSTNSANPETQDYDVAVSDGPVEGGFRRRPGRPHGPLRGRTEEANVLAMFVRHLTAEYSARQLSALFGISQTIWSEYRNGSKIIPLPLLKELIEYRYAHDPGRRLREARRLHTAAVTAEGALRPR